MDKDFTRQLAMNTIDLTALKKIYASANVESELVALDDAIPSTLITFLKNDSKERLISMSHTFVPLPSELFPDIKLLQFYIELPFEIARGSSDELTEINRSIPVGNFGLSENNTIYFRYVATLGRFDVLAELSDRLLDLINLIIAVLDTHSEPIEEAFS